MTSRETRKLIVDANPTFTGDDISLSPSEGGGGGGGSSDENNKNNKTSSSKNNHNDSNNDNDNTDGSKRGRRSTTAASVHSLPPTPPRSRQSTHTQSPPTGKTSTVPAIMGREDGVPLSARPSSLQSNAHNTTSSPAQRPVPPRENVKKRTITDFFSKSTNRPPHPAGLPAKRRKLDGVAAATTVAPAAQAAPTTTAEATPSASPHTTPIDPRSAPAAAAAAAATEPASAPSTTAHEDQQEHGTAQHEAREAERPEDTEVPTPSPAKKRKSRKERELGNLQIDATEALQGAHDAGRGKRTRKSHNTLEASPAFSPTTARAKETSTSTVAPSMADEIQSQESKGGGSDVHEGVNGKPRDQGPHLQQLKRQGKKSVAWDDQGQRGGVTQWFDSGIGVMVPLVLVDRLLLAAADDTDPNDAQMAADLEEVARQARETPAQRQQRFQAEMEVLKGWPLINGQGRGSPASAIFSSAECIPR